MKILSANASLSFMVQDFVRRFPGLATKSGAYNRCKFMSYELALYLRRRGVKASTVHCQGLTANSTWKDTAHQAWVEKPRKEWSHYVVRVGDVLIDVTGRQFDPKIEHPRFTSRAESRQDWETLENDVFMNKVIRDVLVSQLDANRQAKQGKVKKVSPQNSDEQQRLTPPVGA